MPLLLCTRAPCCPGTCMCACSPQAAAETSSSEPGQASQRQVEALFTSSSQRAPQDCTYVRPAPSNTAAAPLATAGATTPTYSTSSASLGEHATGAPPGRRPAQCTRALNASLNVLTGLPKTVSSATRQQAGSGAPPSSLSQALAHPTPATCAALPCSVAGRACGRTKTLRRGCRPAGWRPSPSLSSRSPSRPAGPTTARRSPITT